MVHFDVFSLKGPRRTGAPNLLAIQENVNKKKIISIKQLFYSPSTDIFLGRWGWGGARMCGVVGGLGLGECWLGGMGG